MVQNFMLWVFCKIVYACGYTIGYIQGFCKRLVKSIYAE